MPIPPKADLRWPAGARAVLSASPMRSHRPGQTLEESSFSSLRAKQLVGGSSSPLNQLSRDSGRSAEATVRMCTILWPAQWLSTR